MAACLTGMALLQPQPKILPTPWRASPPPHPVRAPLRAQQATLECCVSAVVVKLLLLLLPMPLRVALPAVINGPSAAGLARAVLCTLHLFARATRSDLKCS